MMLFIPPATCAHEVDSCKYFGVANVYLLRWSNQDATFLRIIRTILNLLEQGSNWLLGIPGPAHVFKVDLKTHRSDVSVSAEEVIQHVSCRDIGEDDHVVIQNVQIYWFKNTNDLFFFKACWTEV
jgi:hypothetical protein